MSYIEFKNNELTLHLEGKLSQEQMQAVNDAMQSQVQEIVTGPDNTPDKLALLDGAAKAIGFKLDLSVENNDASMFEPGQ